MLLVFVDESGDAKFKEYLGFCVATVNARFYPSLKRAAHEILAEVKWSSAVEFKGAYLFSASSGCSDVEIERRVEAAHRLLDLNASSQNSRLRFHYGSMQSKKHGVDYLGKLPGLLARAVPKAPKGAGKNLVTVVCDERTDVSPDELHAVMEPALASRGYVVLERVHQAKSSFDTVGLMFADLVGYLAARIDNISADVELFEGLSSEQIEKNGKLRKLRSSRELIRKIKSLELYKHKSST